MARPGWMPSPTQELLLTAALDASPKAVEAWQMWTQQIDLVHDYLDGDTFRLLSLAYENLSPRLPDDPLMDRLKGITRYHWIKTQLALGYGARVVYLLESHGIPTLLFKGAALISAGYVRASSRVMHDCDLLIPEHERDRALALLFEAGWQPRDSDIPPSRYPMLYSLDLVWPTDRTGLDLHWYALSENSLPGADEDFWKKSVPVRLNGVETRRLNDSDLCFHLLAHGARWENVEPTYRWIADVLLLLRASVVIDWDRICFSAEQRELALLTAAMLAYLRQTYAAPVPSAAIQRLRSGRIQIGQRVEYWVRHHQRSRWDGLSYHIYKYWQLTHGKGRLDISPVRYLCNWWGVSRRVDLPATLVKRARRRLHKP